MDWKETYTFFNISKPCVSFPDTFTEKESMKFSNNQDDKNELK